MAAPVVGFQTSATEVVVFIIIKLRNGDRISRAFESAEEALGILQELVEGEEPLDPRDYGVQEIDAEVSYVGDPILLPAAAEATADRSSAP